MMKTISSNPTTIHRRYFTNETHQDQHHHCSTTTLHYQLTAPYHLGITSTITRHYIFKSRSTRVEMRGLSVGFLILAFTLAFVEAGFEFGRCSFQPPVDPFDFNEYSGEWYEWGRYLTPSQIVAGCTKNILTPNGPLLDVEVEYIFLDRIRAKKGQLKYSDPDKTEAVLTFEFSANGFGDRQNEYTFPNYKVLDTDYTSYAIVYNCIDLYLFQFTDLYIYTRDRQPTEDVIANVYMELYKRNIETFGIARTDQGNCPN
ncbi:Lipocalin/cytosolic fatty-acid binding domain [Trinorchestia longiramus]|nr:Lipocalin/cytosolic fatty-acid binding domain [Trinorchestia longiramus]